MKDIQKTTTEWIGQIPDTWELKKIKYVLANRTENNNPIKTKNILSLTAKQGVIPIEEKEGGGNKPKEDFSAYRLAYPNDIVMNSMNILSGSVGLSKYYGCVSPVYYMLYPISKNDDVRFFNYIFQTTVFQKSLLGLGNGIMMKESGNGKLNTIRMRIPIDKFGNLYIPVPSHQTQSKIADFLDNKCAEIDSIATEIQEQINTLEEYKKSVITEAVTKGLNPNAEMKNSGIRFIGNVPKHWKIKRTKYIAKTITKGNGITKEDVVENGNIQCIRYGEIYSKYDNKFYNTVSTTNIEKITSPKNITEGDILFAGTGELVEEIGKNIVYAGKSPCLAGGDIIVLKHQQNYTFLNYALSSSYAQIQKSISKAKLKVVHISANDISNIYIAIPPLDEQLKIATYLDSKCAEIDDSISDKQQQLETLEQYKRSLIYEYVTGKKEVA